MNQFRFRDLVPTDELQQAGCSMTNRDFNGVRITRLHSEAICAEVGERLRAALPANPDRLSPDLLRLTKRLDGVEVGDTPSRN
jgi:hypothetical protein